jgi:hypothetical protein
MILTFGLIFLHYQRDGANGEGRERTKVPMPITEAFDLDVMTFNL